MSDLESMGRAYFAHKDAIYDLLVANRNEQKRNIELWMSLQTSTAVRIPDRYFPRCIEDAIVLIKSENLDDLQNALDHFVLGDSAAFEKIKEEYQKKMSEMDEPIRLLQEALVEAELEHASLINLQRLIQEVEKLGK